LSAVSIPCVGGVLVPPHLVEGWCTRNKALSWSMCPKEDRPPLRRAHRLILLGVGYLSLAAAGLGAVLPLVPTTVFLLLAAWAFGRASPRLRAKLLADPRFGRILRDWEEAGAIDTRAKRAALSAMGLSWLLMALLARNVLALAVAGACLAAVSVYILTRPSPDQRQEPGSHTRPRKP
jgi:uncharacterized membrane protein YbaN (DUF454 family)